MAFDQTTRNRLQRFVGDARDALIQEFTRQLQSVYGMEPKDGSITPLENLRHLDDAGRETARLLRDTLYHYLAASPSGDRGEALDRIVREQAFTILNRLAALRMAEARDILTESVSKGYDSKGFQLYLMLAGTGHGETGEAYRSYLFSIFDEFALDLNVLFDRFSPQGRLFPREAALLQLLGLMNDPEVAPLWGEDETIGWIYQYFNSKEERKKMRDDSPAPRNSRELAVRNQFFTPRYVVEFLTDNTLGRIWYEMTRGETRLKDKCRYLVRRPNEVFLESGEAALEVEETAEQNLSQEELMKRPVYIPHRPLKDPRTIRVLDPACGSMHFGLYAYDLLEVIYEEAWELEGAQGADAFSREPGIKPLREPYADKESYLRDVPRLIIEHNLHGIDIDPRAVQIAGLSLWLRAQRAWANQGVKPSARPQVKRSNIVCAEPMPGEESLLKEFVDKNLSATPELRLLGQLVRHVFDAMKLAGEAGSLLKIETEIADAVAEAKQRWLEVPTPKQDILFVEMARPEQQRLGYEVEGITDEAFWERAEKLIYDALRSYAEQSENGGGYQRRLFAEDAARGFAFIDLCRNRYNVVLMNPPFGKSTPKAESYLENEYEENWKDLYAAFIEAGENRLVKTGILGCISSSLFLYSKQLRFLREHWIQNASLKCLIELGAGVLDDATVETALTITSKARNWRTLFLDVSAEQDKGTYILGALSNQEVHFVLKSLNEFRMLFAAPFCYHVPSFELDLWKQPSRLDPSLAVVALGNHTFNDERFLRLRFEVPSSSIGSEWVPFEKGGEYQPFLSPTKLIYNWAMDGREARAYQIGIYGTDAQTIQSISFWFREGITYSRVSSIGFGPRLLSKGSIFASESISLFCHDQADILPLLGMLASTWTQDLLNAFGRYRKIENRAVSNLPYYPELIRPLAPQLSTLATRGIALLSWVESFDETSILFSLPEPFAKEEIFTSRRQLKSISTDLQELYRNLDEIISSRLFNEVGGNSLPLSKSRINLVDHFTFRDLADRPAVAISEIISYLVGCCFGRWDVSLAIGERLPSSAFDFFAPLPACAPGMLQNDKRLPVRSEDVPKSYPLRISWPGILVDDPGHAEEIEGRAREVLHVIWPERADSIEQEACEILGIRSLREYFSKPGLFFADHLRRYSKSRRQAPIYWPLSTPSGSYTLWLYYHRLDAQTIYRCVVEFVEPKLRQTNDVLGQLRAKTNRARDEERELERLQDFALELRAFRDELLRVAELPWRPDLNDGVQITAAPFWQLFRLPKWQKTLKETWQKLEKGDYDWAHLAMTVWPARVVPKCVTDRSFAIAHGLEDLFWVEDAGGWRKLRRPEQEIEEQKKRLRTDARERVRVFLGQCAAGEEGSLDAGEVRRRLTEGELDDREVALLLYPRRVADSCWENPSIARRLNIQLPARRSAAAREQFTKKLVKAGCHDIADRLESALRDRVETFRTLWEGMERGDHDDFKVAAAFWPERVVEKCAEDVSMAERHGIRPFLWCSHPSGVWRRREAPDTEVANEITRRRGAGRSEGVNG
jgi:hypothetical protein